MMNILPPEAEPLMVNVRQTGGSPKFITRCHEALSHQSQGHPEPSLELWSHADDVTIMAAAGGYHVGFEQVSNLLRWASKAQSFDSGSAENIVTTVT
jgi:hypothetical protein